MARMTVDSPDFESAARCHHALVGNGRLGLLDDLDERKGTGCCQLLPPRDAAAPWMDVSWVTWMTGSWPVGNPTATPAPV